MNKSKRKQVRKSKRKQVIRKTTYTQITYVTVTLRTSRLRSDGSVKRSVMRVPVGSMPVPLFTSLSRLPHAPHTVAIMTTCLKNGMSVKCTRITCALHSIQTLITKLLTTLQQRTKLPQPVTRLWTQLTSNMHGRLTINCTDFVIIVTV